MFSYDSGDNGISLDELAKRVGFANLTKPFVQIIGESPCGRAINSLPNVPHNEPKPCNWIEEWFKSIRVYARGCLERHSIISYTMQLQRLMTLALYTSSNGNAHGK
jgi:hypothetical protein